jgi:[calcium/calmodulin-dependent protein kinase] kinase
MDQSMNSFAGDCEQPGHAGDITKREAEIGILPSHGMIDLDVPARPVK